MRPHEMTQQEFYNEQMKEAFANGVHLRHDDIATKHEDHVRAAVARGEPVAAKVLRDYPALHIAHASLKAPGGTPRLNPEVAAEMAAKLSGATGKNFSADDVATGMAIDWTGGGGD